MSVPGNENVRSQVEPSMPSGSKIRKHGEAIRVLLVDDHPVIRQVLCSFFSTHYPDIEVVGEASSGEEALQCVETLRPSVVIMDIHMPGLNGIEATVRIKRTHPHVAVVGLSISIDEDYRRAMITAGATALVSKKDRDVVEQLYDQIIKSSAASK